MFRQPIQRFAAPDRGGSGAHKPKQQRAPMFNSPSDQLTTREQEIMCLVCIGLTNRQIARELIISPHTVRAHLHNCFAKFDAHTRTAAAMTFMIRYPDAFNDRTESG